MNLYFSNNSPRLTLKKLKRISQASITHQNPYVNSKQAKNLSKTDTKNPSDFAYLAHKSAGTKYNDVEHFVIDLVNNGYDLIDVLILAREQFDSDKLDNYLYEMRDKGII